MGAFVWDEEKRLSNLSKHAIDFGDAVIIFDGATLTIEDDLLSMNNTDLFRLD